MYFPRNSDEVTKMRIPEPLFFVINRVVKLVLRSPIHRILSKSIMLIRFRGLKTGKEYATPVRYMVRDDQIYCFSNDEARWWRNIKDGTLIRLLIKGDEGPFIGRTILDGPTIRPELLAMLEEHPKDADYHGLILDEDGNPDNQCLDKTLEHTVMVVATPLN